MLLALVVACEIGFWLILGAGLVARYLLRWRRTSTVLLVSVPLVDVVLLAATIVDLRRGATADWTHGLAAAYIGFSVAYGHYLVRWADSWFLHRFADGPRPPKPPKYGTARAVHEWKIAARTALSCAIALVLLQAAIWMVGDATRTKALHWAQVRMLWIAGINALVALTYTLWPKRPVSSRPPCAGSGSRSGERRSP
ncbi:hypothetical protein [Yinghuangia seranimata]|uniref:hypothetical protein n=1 Tax=Yinghuangia seranimata TaxID=408067 RepID=UPI00248C355D|nr:hypothetical protein [Yinghuangia seranimata]MDI2125788.1 hypothetical protein [Yinghuangia seranimata]